MNIDDLRAKLEATINRAEAEAFDKAINEAQERKESMAKHIGLLETALLRCLREIPPQHIPGDLYEEAQRLLK